MYALGDSMDVLAGDDLSNAYAADPQLAQLHQLALLIVALRNQFDTTLSQIGDASVSVDPDALAILSQQLSATVAQFQAFRQTINVTTANANALGAVDQAILDIGAWASNAAAFVASIPKAVLDTGTGAVQAILDALGKIALTTGKNAAMALVWPAVILGAALLFVGKAEKTRTYRKVVA